MLLNGSKAVTVTEVGTPETAVLGALTDKCEAAAALTVMGPVLPVCAVGTALSVAVMVTNRCS